ncbi:hypothetical protein XENOCAPTIV_004087, partial [Xenoophorus captivus]
WYWSGKWGVCHCHCPGKSCSQGGLARSQNIFESLRDSSEKSNGRILLSEIHSRNSRNLKHNSSTQTEIFCPDVGSASSSSISGERRKARGESDEIYGDMSKPFSTVSLHATSLRPLADLGTGRYGPSAFQECCSYTKAPSSLPFEPISHSECISMETALEKKHSGGTWPKMMVGGISVVPDNASPITAATQLSIYKSPKQRKSVFDPDTFKRPETPSSKLEYLAANQITAAASHSPQDMLHSSPGPSNRHSVGLVPAVYNGSLPPSKLLKPHMLKR